MKPAQPPQSSGPQPKLSPTLLARLERMAAKSGKTIEQVLEDAVMVQWIRFAAKEKVEW